MAAQRRTGAAETFTVRFSQEELEALLVLVQDATRVGTLKASPNLRDELIDRFHGAQEDGPDDGVFLLEGARQPRKEAR